MVDRSIEREVVRTIKDRASLIRIALFACVLIVTVCSSVIAGLSLYQITGWEGRSWILSVCILFVGAVVFIALLVAEENDLITDWIAERIEKKEKPKENPKAGAWKEEK